MTISDAIIIYLACGTPFGVHCFLKNRNSVNFSWLKALLVTIFWIPFAIIQLHAYVTNRLNSGKPFADFISSSANEAELDLMKKEFESFLPDDRSANSFYSFREIVETYAGLTLALEASTDAENNPFESELFNIAGNKNEALGSICLARRNLSRLTSHQRDSRNVFLAELESIFRSTLRRQDFIDHSLRFVELLCDKEAFDLVSKLKSIRLQTKSPNTVTREESIIWDLEKQKRSTQIAVSQNLKPSTAAAHSLKKN